MVSRSTGALGARQRIKSPSRASVATATRPASTPGHCRRTSAVNRSRSKDPMIAIEAKYGCDSV
jgi:hypothetical protein